MLILIISYWQRPHLQKACPHPGVVCGLLKSSPLFQHRAMPWEASFTKSQHKTVKQRCKSCCCGVDTSAREKVQQSTGGKEGKR